MPTSIAYKLRIKQGYSLLTLNAPVDFNKGLSNLPEGVKLVTNGKEYQQVHWFVLNKAQAGKGNEQSNEAATERHDRMGILPERHIQNTNRAYAG